MKSAEHTDLPDIQRLYHEATLRARRTGGFIDWPHPFPMDRIEQYHADGTLYTFEEDSETVATVRMYENCSEQIWPDVATANALYIGKIATSDSIAGRGYMLDTILPEVIEYADTSDYQMVRFDSLATNERQMKLYERSPFRRVGTATINSINTGDSILLAKWQYDL